jgi:carbon-monoxide dehydrogenase medium subunit
LCADIVEDIRIVFFSVGPTPLRARGVEATLRGGDLSAASILESLSALADELEDASEDAQTSATTRRHLAGVLLRRQLGALRPARAA